MADRKHHFLDGPMSVVQSLDLLGARLACESLIVQYAFLIDFGQAAAVPDLFTDDGVLEKVGGPGEATSRTEGRAALSERFAARAALAERRTRHVMTNVGVNVSDEDHAQGASYLTLYRADGVAGDGPAPLEQPAAVGEYRDEFRRGADGIWRFSHRQLHAGFLAGGTTL